MACGADDCGPLLAFRRKGDFCGYPRGGNMMQLERVSDGLTGQPNLSHGGELLNPQTMRERGRS